MAVLIPKKMEKNKLMAYLAIIVIMAGGIIFFIFKMRSSAPADVENEPAATPRELIETEPIAPAEDNKTAEGEIKEEKIEENMNLNIFIDPKFKALRDNSVD